MRDWTKAKTPQENTSTKNIRKLLEELDSPQDKIPLIHISGTNGKGSILTFLEGIFRANGYKTGVFTSPYLWDITDSIQVNNENIKKEDFNEQLEQIEKVARENNIEITEFEILTAMAFKYFYQEQVDIAIIETGMGGRDDATNVIASPLAVVFAHISLDHTNILGSTIEEIADNKSDIIKPGAKIFSLPQEEKVRKILDSKGQVQYLDLREINNRKTMANGNSYDYKGQSYYVQLPGAHQIVNSALALVITDSLIEEFPQIKSGQKPGLENAKIPGRIETIQENPRLIIDGAHNQASLDALLIYLKDLEYKKLILGFGVLADKDYDYFVDQLMPLADQIVLTTINNPRKLDPEILYSKLPQEIKEKTKVEKDLENAVKLSQELAEEGDLILWCGSFYLIKDVRTIILS